MAGVDLNLDYTTDIDFTSSSSLSVQKNTVIREKLSASNLDIVSQTPSWLFAVRNATVNGYHKDENGLRYYSFDNDIVIQGSFGSLTVLKNEILKCNDIACDNVSIFYTFERSIMIDAFAVDLSGFIYFSVAHATVINGLSVFPADIVQLELGLNNYTLAVNSQYPINGLVMGINKNIDAISKLSEIGGTGYFISFKDEGCFTGTPTICFNNISIIFIDNSTSTAVEPFVSPSYFGTYENPVNLNSLTITVPSDLIFKNSFE